MANALQLPPYYAGNCIHQDLKPGRAYPRCAAPRPSSATSQLPLFSCRGSLSIDPVAYSSFHSLFSYLNMSKYTIYSLFCQNIIPVRKRPRIKYFIHIFYFIRGNYSHPAHFYPPYIKEKTYR